ncbi:peptidylprolyl isomerase [Ectothiorhodospira lacustris]|uniref:peptidylprolyl isomerase n=1 Tax=Ectothiorhodospira lacustris TaxID=2899127 RepID=UPI001EE8B596|nr:peptidyl-prolyl cis-trans isomerase [Ectothiorhodospira lacustris]MCG5510933.1 peptidyl-prolyl cis-trans isomerase [Ectothiorhodospira lacustris]MCG5522665.1 peptidyl-prolyl cis-trans isomerase [Ectothiorhodospira lacustris]
MIRQLALCLTLLSATTGTQVMAENTAPRVTLETNKGTIVLELYADKAPETVANFLAYAGEGFYDGTIFHRVIPGFMVQGGGFTQDMQQKPTKDPIRNEANNGLSNEVGTVAMARTPNPHSATAQFFINVQHNRFLDFTAETPQGWGYAVFGKVVEGMDVVESIVGVSTGNHGMHQDVPREPVIMTRVSAE